MLSNANPDSPSKPEIITQDSSCLYNIGQEGVPLVPSIPSSDLPSSPVPRVFVGTGVLLAVDGGGGGASNPLGWWSIKAEGFVGLGHKLGYFSTSERGMLGRFSLAGGIRYGRLALAPVEDRDHRVFGPNRRVRQMIGAGISIGTSLDMVYVRAGPTFQFNLTPEIGADPLKGRSFLPGFEASFGTYLTDWLGRFGASPYITFGTHDITKGVVYGGMGLMGSWDFGV